MGPLGLTLRRCRWCSPGLSLEVPELRRADVCEVSVPFKSNNITGRDSGALGAAWAPS